MSRIRGNRLKRLAPLFGAALIATLLFGCGGSSASELVPADQAATEDAWGIRITGVRLAAGGGMIDVRYRIVDEERALAALAPSARGHGELSLEHVAETPLIIDQDTGYALREMELHQAGRVRTQRLDPKVGIERYMLFGNVSGLIEKGSPVAFAIAGVRLEPLIVQ